MKQSKTLWRRALLVAAIGAAIAVWRYETPSQAVATRPIRSDTTASVQGGLPVGASADALVKAGPAERALDLNALRKSLAGRKDAEAEVRRIVEFARFRDQVEAYGNGRSSMPEAERARLARAILAELPEHVASHEIVPVQAEALSVALLTDAESDPTTRSAAIQAAQQQWDAYARQTVGPSPAQDPRYLTYTQQSRDIIQQVQASVPDPAQQQLIITQRLQALRVQLFDSTSSPNTH
ncbi:phospholipase C accessory protein PlcR [Trinickia fusca]|uniref:Phospholipase C accessory protein PlcR n=1 Tax=Trinickia fusca TaxID=2419777 RepID=A0A494XKZ5_9BURK|nr:phospholipase C accessory protein PlcR [Trinickia fusca]RKP48213.1 phospholipase C accessory protein PlcR [Trinickia fusca]